MAKTDRTIGRRSLLLSAASGFVLMTTEAWAARSDAILRSSAALITAQDAAVRDLADRVWHETLATDLQARGALGLDVIDVLFVTQAEHDRRCRFAAGIVAELSRVEASKLSEPWLVMHGWIQQMVGAQADLAPYYWHDFAIVPYKIYRALEALHASARQMDLASPAGGEAFLSLTLKYARFIAAHGSKLREQQRRKFVLPNAAIAPLVGMLRSLTDELPTNLAVSAGRIAAIPASQQAEFTRRLETNLTKVRAELAQLIAYLSGKYAVEAPEAISVRQYPGGRDYYRVTAKSYITMDMEPTEIHTLGLRQIEQISAILRPMAIAKGHPSILALLAARRTDPKYKVGSAQQVLDLDQALMARMKPKLPAYFSRLPKADFATSPLPPSLRSMSGYYAPPTLSAPTGRFFFPAFEPAKLSMFGRARLIYHELMPGHHMQMGLAVESEGLHPLHRFLWNSAYAEGWGDYACNLAVEMGLMDADERLKLLANALAKAAQLVADTGIGDLGWTLDQAETFLCQHMDISASEIHIEAIRYATRPGQALTYKLGYDKMRALRERAEQRLGPRFDIRDYHAMVLEYGSLPLITLEARVDRYIGRLVSAA